MELHPVLFASAAVLLIGRWSEQDCTEGLKIMYSSLVRSQESHPVLFLHSDSPQVIPAHTTMQTATNIIPILIDVESVLKDSPYNMPWHALSRAKLDFVEKLIREHGKPVVWIDLDTLLFVDISKSFALSSSWVLGFHHGGCEGKLTCSALSEPITPAFDAQGDMWSLDLAAIAEVRKFEYELLLSNSTLPSFDLQGYFSMMLQRRILSADLLHRLLPFNFGFACSSFTHPTAANLKITFSRTESKMLQCPLHIGVDMPKETGGISFTASTFSTLLLHNETPQFKYFGDETIQSWFLDWFYSPLPQAFVAQYDDCLVTASC